jgi:hypothetical protein
MIGITLGGILSIRLLGVPASSRDTIAFAWPIGLITVRIGCMLGGCCYGTPTHSILSIHYEGCESNLHPTQFYEMVICLSLLAATYFVLKKNYLKKPGNLGLFTLLYYAFFRFFIEFIRAGGIETGGLKLIQWLLLVSIFGLAFYIYFSEKSYSFKRVEIKPKFRHAEALLFGLFFILSLFAFKILTRLESVLLMSVIGILIINYFQKLVIHTADYRIFRNQVALIFLSILMMSQTSIKDSTLIKYENDITLGAVGGQYSGICGDVVTFGTVVAGYEGKYNFSSNHSVMFNTGYYKLREGGTLAHGLTQTLGYQNPYFKLAGGMNLDIWRKNSYDTYETTQGNNNYILVWEAAPVIDLRIGKRFFVEGKYNQPLYGQTWFSDHLHIGIGLNFEDIRRVSVGLSNNGFYIDSYFNFNNGIHLSPYISFDGENSHAIGAKVGIKFPYAAKKKPLVAIE